jgi:FAD/FMN-containing dehydrogenase
MQPLFRKSIEKLKSKVKGNVILPDDSIYNEARKVWNAMIDRRPAVIVQCADAGDVPQAIFFARENGLEISIRGAGHNIAGNAVYGPNYTRLVKIKREHDPDNIFHMNQNIKP